MNRLCQMSLLSACVLIGTTAHAQKPPAFDIADVRASPASTVFGGDGGALRGERYIIRQATMLDLIASAYSLDATNVQGGPPWLEMNRYDIVAKTAPNTPPATQKLMLQALLAERFGLVVHTASKPMPAYLLTQGRGKPKLKEAAGGDPECNDKQVPAAESGIRNIALTCKNKTMDALAQDLHGFAAGYLKSPVINATHLDGEWDYDLVWTGSGQLVRAGVDGISIFDAVDKGLGLKLTLETAPRPVLVVDKVAEQPTPNSPNLAKLFPQPPPATFDVAVIKPADPKATDTRGSMSKNQVKIDNMNLKYIIAVAWNYSPDEGDRVIGPKWLDNASFDILAKLAPDFAVANGTNVSPIDTNELLHMFQALVVERFHMQFHMEDRALAAYTLTAVSPKLHPAADPTARTRCAEGPGPEALLPGYKDPRISNPILNRLISCTNMTLPQMAQKFQEIANGYIHGDVFDKTGITGSYDFTISFSSAGQNAGGGGAAPPSGSPSDPTGALTLFEAVSRQLGLKLEKQKRPVPVLVIDHIDEKPTEN